MSGYLNEGGSETPKFRRNGGNPLRNALPGAIVVIGAVAAWYFLFGPGVSLRRRPEARPADATAEAKPVEKRPAAVEPPAAVTNAAAKVEKPKKEKAKKPELKNDPRYPYTDGRTVLSSKTNGWNQIVDICRMPDGRSRKVIRPAKPPTFVNASDQMLAHALSGTMDEDLPPLPISEDLEEDFVESLKTPIVINDDDSDAIKEAKERVIAAREYIDGEMRKGRGFYEVVSEHVAQRKANSEAREQAMEIVSELRASGDAEALNQYVESVNELFRARDIGEISAELKVKGEGNE